MKCDKIKNNNDNKDYNCNYWYIVRYYYPDDAKSKSTHYQQKNGDSEERYWQ